MADKKKAKTTTKVPSKSKDLRGQDNQRLSGSKERKRSFGHAERSSARKDKVVHVAGKRKLSVARATIRKGRGFIKINNRILDSYQPEIAKLRIQEPILLAGDVNNLNINVNVRGGGWSSQAEASRLAIAKALVEYTGSADLRKKYLEYDRHLLVADTRFKEAKKPGTHSHARKKRQLSKR